MIVKRQEGHVICQRGI